MNPRRGKLGIRRILGSGQTREQVIQARVRTRSGSDGSFIQHELFGSFEWLMRLSFTPGFNRVILAALISKTVSTVCESAIGKPLKRFKPTACS